MLPVVIVIALAIVALLAIEFFYVAKGYPTISARLQVVNAHLGPQLVAGIFFLLGAMAGWFVAHFTSPAP